MREEIRERKKNNKGFSLVELIIVIAIMAILVAILAPQFLKYVERSRNTADVANAREMSNAVIAYIADSEVEDTIEQGKTTIKTSSTGTEVTGTSPTTVANALREAGITTNEGDKLNDIKCKSKTTWKEYQIDVNVDANGIITFEYTATPDSERRFAASFQQGTGSSDSSGSGSGGTTGGDSGSGGGTTGGGTGDSTGGNAGG
ncbi:MAG: prepilin-type N-terminal cleavage/methylation domain-containing protein [Lachnospiraceae bacterium]|nr:prepilin-type N-terminal cleavage/methylation domain-containing protein [Lachnospiraceae bacterium]